jgi:hypothetical protein
VGTIIGLLACVHWYIFLGISLRARVKFLFGLKCLTYRVASSTNYWQTFPRVSYCRGRRSPGFSAITASSQVYEWVPVSHSAFKVQKRGWKSFETVPDQRRFRRSLGQICSK